jgi:hypothetical protein
MLEPARYTQIYKISPHDTASVIPTKYLYVPFRESDHTSKDAEFHDLSEYIISFRLTNSYS